MSVHDYICNIVSDLDLFAIATDLIVRSITVIKIFGITEIKQ